MTGKRPQRPGKTPEATSTHAVREPPAKPPQAPARDPWRALVAGLRARLDAEPSRPDLLARLSCEGLGLAPEEIQFLEAMATGNQVSLGALLWNAWSTARGEGFATRFARPEAQHKPTPSGAGRRRRKEKP